MPDIDLDELHRRYVEQLPTVCAVLLPDNISSEKVFRQVAQMGIALIDAIIEELEAEQEEDEDEG